MTRPIEAVATQVEQGLCDRSSSLERVGPTRWSLVLANGTGLPAQVDLDDGWVAISASPDEGHFDASRDDIGRIMQLGSNARGMSRVGIVGGAHSVWLFADVPISKGADVPHRVAAACADLESAAGLIAARNSRNAVDFQAPITTDEGSKEAAAQKLPDLCAQAGWPCAVRSSGRVTIDLDVPGGFFQAQLDVEGDSGFVARVKLADFQTLSPKCRDSVAAFLLVAVGQLRMVRPAMREQDGRVEVHIEAGVPADVQPGDLNDAFASLSMACAACHREVQCLADEFVAGNYLAAQGWGKSPRRPGPAGRKGGETREHTRDQSSSQ